jgi:putative tryptophan/tyrosine transport system substrate-binding protein
MRLIGLAVILTLSLALAAFTAEAQQAGKVYRVGLLTITQGSPDLMDGFRQGLREHGYTEGQNLALERRASEGKSERFPQLAQELVGLQVDVIVCVSNAATRAAKEATQTIPIVMAGNGSPEQFGFIASLARPGGNVTGLTIDTGPEIEGKKLQLLKEVAPSITRVALVLTMAQSETGIILSEVTRVAQTLGLTIEPVRLPDATQLPTAFEAITAARAQAIALDSSTLGLTHRRQILDFTSKQRLPGIYAFRAFPESGGLMSYGVDTKDLARRTGGYVARILRGTKPSDLPVEQPTKFELVINVKTAKALGLTIPPSVLGRADQVIE